jgi:uncharacterized membrane protein
MGSRSRRNRKRDNSNELAPLPGIEISPQNPTTLDRPDASPDGLVRQGELFPQAIVRSARFAGPLPPPAILRDYEAVIPGLGERIVRMAEKEGDHRRAVETQLVNLSGWGLACATAICLVALIGGFFLLWQGKNLSGLAPIILALGAVITTLVLQRNAEPPADTVEDDEKEE